MKIRKLEPRMDIVNGWSSAENIYTRNASIQTVTVGREISQRKRDAILPTGARAPPADGHVPARAILISPARRKLRNYGAETLIIIGEFVR